MTCHAPRKSDPDKAACRVRFSHNPARTVASKPGDIDCELCSILVFQFQRHDGIRPENMADVWPEGFGP